MTDSEARLAMVQLRTWVHGKLTNGTEPPWVTQTLSALDKALDLVPMDDQTGQGFGSVMRIPDVR